MLDALYTFTMRIAAMSVLCVLMECLIPQGKLKKTAQLCIGVLFVLCIAAPVVGCAGQELSYPSPEAEEYPVISQTPTYEDIIRGYYESGLAID